LPQITLISLIIFIRYIFTYRFQICAIREICGLFFLIYFSTQSVRRTPSGWLTLLLFVCCLFSLQFHLCLLRNLWPIFLFNPWNLWLIFP